MASSSSSSSSIPPQQTSNPDTTTNNPNSNSNSKSASIRIPQSRRPPHHHASSSTPFSASASPTSAVAKAGADGSTTSAQGHTQLQSQPHFNSNSHEQHFYQQQQQHHHPRSHSAAISLGGMMPGSVPPPPSTSPINQMPSPGHMGVASIPGAPYYYHPYALFPPAPPAPHSHHGPPPPHPPAPPAPPRANRPNISQLQDTVLHSQRASADAGPNPFSTYASAPGSVSASIATVQDANHTERMNGPARRSRGPSTSSSPSLRGASPSLSITTSMPMVQSSSSTLSPSPHMSSRPQLIPTFSYYRSQANYDKQHGLLQRGGNQIHPSDNVVADAAFPDQAHVGRSPSVFSSTAANDGDQQNVDENDDENDNDNGIGVDEYEGDMPAPAMHTHAHGAMQDLPIDPSILPPATSSIPAASSSSLNNNYMLSGGEKRPNHEYYPSPHHQVHFREIMVANNSTHLPDPHISLNSLVDSEPGKKPAYPLPTIIRCAILGSPQERLTLSELYLAMERRFSYYTLGDRKSWRNSVRHNLSLNNLFEKVTRPITEPGKGCYWVVAHDKPPGNKRERKRNKKPGKKALAAMEREKQQQAAAAASETQSQNVTVGNGRQTDDEEGDDDAGEDEDDIDDQDQTITLNTTTSGARRRNVPSGSTSSTSASNVPATYSPYNTTTTTPVLTPMTTTSTIMRPPFGNAYSRGTVAPNEGSYAAVTGVIPMLSQIPLPSSFGIGMGAGGGMGVDAASVSVSGSTSAQVSTTAAASGLGYSNPIANEGPFSAYTPQSPSGGGGFGRNNAQSALMGFGNAQAQTGADMNVGSTSSSTGMSMWNPAASNRASTAESATGGTTTSSKRKRKTTSTRNGENLTAVPGTTMMSQHAGEMIQNPESGLNLGPSMMRNPSQESGAGASASTGMSPASSSAFTQATSMQSSSSSQPFSSQGRMAASASTTPFTGSASPSPAALGRASLTLGPAVTTQMAQPLSAQSSFGSSGFSVPESVATTSSAGSGGETSASASATTNQPGAQRGGTLNQSLGPHRTTRQNPMRRFDPVVPSPITSGLQSFNSATSNNINNNSNRPRDTFNTLAAQIASEFSQTRTTSTSSDTPVNFGGSGSTAARKRSQSSRGRPKINGLRGSKKHPRRGGGSQSEGSEDEDEDEGSEEDEDEDEYVPAGSAKRRGRRK